MSSVGTASSPSWGGHFGKGVMVVTSALVPCPPLLACGVPQPLKQAGSAEAGLAPDPRAPGLLWGSSWDVCVGVGGGQRCSLAAKEAATARCCSGMHSSADTVALKPFISV